MSSRGDTASVLGPVRDPFDVREETLCQVEGMRGQLRTRAGGAVALGAVRAFMGPRRDMMSSRGDTGAKGSRVESTDNADESAAAN